MLLAPAPVRAGPIVAQPVVLASHTSKGTDESEPLARGDDAEDREAYRDERCEPPKRLLGVKGVWRAHIEERGFPAARGEAWVRLLLEKHWQPVARTLCALCMCAVGAPPDCTSAHTVLHAARMPVDARLDRRLLI